MLLQRFRDRRSTSFSWRLWRASSAGMSPRMRAAIRRGLVDAEYVAVCDQDLGRAGSFAEITGARLVTSDPGELIDSPDVNVIYICVPTSGHKDLVLRAAKQGKHVFCEKPLAP